MWAMQVASAEVAVLWVVEPSTARKCLVPEVGLGLFLVVWRGEGGQQSKGTRDVV